LHNPTTVVQQFIINVVKVHYKTAPLNFNNQIFVHLMYNRSEEKDTHSWFRKTEKIDSRCGRESVSQHQNHAAKENATWIS
jgi:hypothetical protein